MRVDGVGLSQTLINHYFYGILDHFFVEDFRQIHGKSTKSLKLRGTQVPNLWGGSVHKFGSFVPNKIVFYGFPLAPIKLGTLPKA